MLMIQFRQNVVSAECLKIETISLYHGRGILFCVKMLAFSQKVSIMQIK